VATTATAQKQGKPSLASRLAARAGGGVAQIFLVLVALFWLMPTLGLLISSLRDSTDIATSGWWEVFTAPAQLTTSNYSELLSNDAITNSLWTTVLITVPSTVLVVVIGSLAGYAFAWLDFPGRDWWFLLVVGLLVVPVQVALIPVAKLFGTLGIFETTTGVVIFHTAFGLPFAIFLLRNFFIGIPKDLMEAARIDGASEIRIFLRLILPLGLPAIASLGIFQFLWTWNDLLVALTFGRETQPITVAIFSQLRQFGANVDLIAPATFISLAIPLAVFFAFQRFFVQGLLAGSVK
jgi:alpha-glucoside transport system permease protein